MMLLLDFAVEIQRAEEKKHGNHKEPTATTSITILLLSINN